MFFPQRPWTDSQRPETRMAASPLLNTGFVKQRSVRNVMTWNHGTNGLLISYAISVATLFLGLLLGRAPALRLLLSPLIAIPVLIVAVILWTAMAVPLKKDPQTRHPAGRSRTQTRTRHSETQRPYPRGPTRPRER